MNRLQQLQQEIADDAARCEIESYCARPEGVGSPWHGLKVDDPEMQQYVSDAAEYLTLRGMIERHTEHSDWVRVDVDNQVSEHYETQPDGTVIPVDPADMGIEVTPINMILHCPSCGKQHIDAPKACDAEHCRDGCACPGDCLSWGNPPHRSHLCHYCSHIWRPADVPTNGVLHIQTFGENDSRRFSRNALPAKDLFQSRVQPWLLECFGAEIAGDKMERNHRFFEESTELVQSCGMTRSEAHQLVDYVYGRPVGEPTQETGGVMVTLAALCLANGLNMHEAAEIELARIWTKVEQIRAKQAAKPKHSPLPVAHPCQVSPSEFDHDFEHKDYSFNHEYGTEQIIYAECKRCGFRMDGDFAE